MYRIIGLLLTNMGELSFTSTIIISIVAKLGSPSGPLSSALTYKDRHNKLCMYNSTYTLDISMTQYIETTKGHLHSS